MNKTIFKQLKKEKGNWLNETEVRQGWIKIIGDALNIPFQMERQRVDASYNRVIIEFKDKGLFNGSTSSSAFKNAVFDRLKKYIPTRAKLESLDNEDYIGIVTDAEHIAFARYSRGKIVHDALLPLSESSVSLIVKALTDCKWVPVTSENLITDFGHSSDAGCNMLQALSDALSERLEKKNNNKIKMIFEEWKALYGQTSNLSISQVNGILDNIGFQINFSEQKKAEELKIPVALFVIHTYNSLLIKILGAEVVAEHALTTYKGFIRETVSLDGQLLIDRMEYEIEQGNFFSGAGINGFGEEVIFSWYLDVARLKQHQAKIIDGLKGILLSFSMYRADKLTSARSKDVLKSFYQDLVPNELRKSLGEFYTPEWLVEVTLDRINVKNFLTQRFLDPTCGSASFLLALIRKIKIQAADDGWGDLEVLKHIINNVWGFDLNPLAVQTARVNILIAISDLLDNNKGTDIEIPILLADAVYSPARNPKKDELIVSYKIGSEVADLEILLPSELAFDRSRLDSVFLLMDNLVSKSTQWCETEKKLIQKKLIKSNEMKKWRAPLKHTYEKILDLHERNWNGIWFRIVRNFFWSAIAGKFDVVVGNPPWVRWSKLPELYRERIKPTCDHYGIFSKTKFHGGNELDISGMITYTVADKWLKDEDGILAFVITQTHFQSPSSAGFRSFYIGNNQIIQPVGIDDLKALKPFPDAANKTAIFIAKKSKGNTIKYPIPYAIWEAAKGNKKAIPAHLTKQEALDSVCINKCEANPVTGGNSPWAITQKGGFKAFKKITGASTWVNGRKGVTTELNGIYFVKIIDTNKNNNLVQIETCPDFGRNEKVKPARKFWIEPDFLYPLVKGAGDIQECYVSIKKDLYVLVPNKGITKQLLEDCENEMADKPKCEGFFSTYQDQLILRSTYSKRMTEHAPYFCISNVGSYTFAPFKVVWPEQPGNKSFRAAVITKGNDPISGQKVFVPDHKLFFVDFYDSEPAYYLCGLLNSSTVQAFIDSHNISIQVGNVFKHMNLPEFDADNKKHKELSALSEVAHNEDNKIKRQSLLKTISKLGNSLL